MAVQSWNITGHTYIVSIYQDVGNGENPSQSLREQSGGYCSSSVDLAVEGNFKQVLQVLYCTSI